MNSAILLAAGKSTRMKRLKALLPWGDTTLIERQVEEIARSKMEELIIVLGFKDTLILPRLMKMKQRFEDQIKIKIINNQEYELGKTTSIRQGMNSLSSKSKVVAIIGVDQPVLAKTIDYLLSDLFDMQIKIPVYKGKKGHPPVFTASFYSDIKAINEETEGLRYVVRKYSRYVETVNVDKEQVLLNLNREQDYQYAKENQLDSYKK